MRRFLSTRYGFFAFAALISFAAWFVIEPEHAWVPVALGSLYAVLSVLFFFDERGRAKPRRPAKD